MNTLFSLLKKKHINDLGRRPLNLPVLESEQINWENISTYLFNGVPIWAWYTVDKMPSTSDFTIEKTAHGLESNMRDNFELYRKEKDYLCKYYAHFDGKQLHMKLYSVELFTPENVKKLVTDELSIAYEVYHDDENLAGTQVLFYRHDITVPVLEEYLSGHETMYVTDEHFLARKDEC